MSLIMDAQKAAQREKDKRAGAGSDRVPLLVPLKTKDKSGNKWRGIAFISLGVVVVAGVSWILLSKNGDAIPRALRTPGPTIASIEAPAAATKPLDAPPTEEARPDAKVPAAAPRTKAPTASPPNTASRRATTRVAVRPPVYEQRSTTEPQPAPGRSSDLRITVDDPRSAEVARLFATAVTAQRAGDVNNARTAYQQVLNLAPNHVDALNNLGVLYTSMRQLVWAEQTLRRAISLAPSSAGPWVNLGTVLRERGQSSDAIAAFQHALSLEPNHPGANVGIAQQYLVIGSLTQARQHLDAVLAVQPASPEANYALGQVLERLGDTTGAVSAYTTFIRVAPASHATYVEAVRRRVTALTTRTP